MAGYIKLWRTLIDNGHYRMPPNAFKIFILFIQLAAHKAQPGGRIKVGQLITSYNHIASLCSEENKIMSYSTISHAMKYLVEHGYIEISHKAKGLPSTVTVLNFEKYQTARADSDIYSPSPTETVAPSVVPTVVVGVAVPVEIQEGKNGESKKKEYISSSVSRSNNLLHRSQNDSGDSHDGGVRQNDNQKGLCTANTGLNATENGSGSGKVIELFCRLYEQTYKAKPVIGKSDAKNAEEIANAFKGDLETIEQYLADYWENDWVVEHRKHSIQHACQPFMLNNFTRKKPGAGYDPKQYKKIIKIEV